MWKEDLSRSRERLNTIASIRDGDINVFQKQMDEVLDYDEKRLQKELERARVLKGNKDLEAAIAELHEKGLEKSSEATRERIAAAKLLLAQEKALTDLNTDRSRAASREMLHDVREQTGAGASRFDLRGQIAELKETLSEGDITEPSTILAILKKNPLIAAASLGLSQIPNMESRGMGISIPMLGRFQVPGSDFGNVIREGQVTGGGYREGLGARWDAFRMGLNPFDIMSKEVSAAIVRGVRSRGFTGALGDAFQDAVGDIYQDTGLDPEMVMGMGDQFARRNQLEQFRALIGGMDDLAKETNRSITDVAAGFEELRKMFETFGGFGTAGPNAQALNETLLKQFPGLAEEEMAGLRGWMGQALPMLSGRPASMALGPQLNESMATMVQSLSGFSAGMEGMTEQQRREHLAVLASTPMFQGLTVTQISQMLRDPQKFFNDFTKNQRTANIEMGRATGADILARAEQAGRPNIRDERDEFATSIEKQLERAGFRGPQAKSLMADLRGAVDSRGDWTWNQAMKRVRTEIPRWTEFRGERRADRLEGTLEVKFKGRAAEILEAEFKHRRAVRGETDHSGTRHAGADFG